MKTADAVRQLTDKLGNVILNRVDFLNEITLEIDKQNLKQVLEFFKQTPEPGYEVLMDLTGVDYLVPYKRTKVVYWLHNPVNYERVRIILYANRDEAIPSVTDLWQGANWYERELYDLFGVRFDGHPDMKRILLPDDWRGHPLRRDYSLSEEPVEFKHGVEPKVPSQIVPNSDRKFNEFGTYVKHNERH
jgi:NADH-quinone oxidoreductase subunit C